MSNTMDVNAIIDAVPGRQVPAKTRNAGYVLIAIGILAVAYGFATGDKVWTWGAILVGIVYSLAIAQGGILFGAMMTVTLGRWGRPVKRIAETFGFFLPVVYVILALFLFFGIGLYPWHADTFLEGGVVDLKPHFEGVVASKAVWLNKPFFIARQLIGLAFLIVLDFMYLRASLRPDLIQASKRLGDKSPKWWGYFTAGAGELDVELQRCQRQQHVVAAVLFLSYALLFSMLAFDLIMSLSPWWYANMFGAWTFVSAFWLALATLGVVSMLSRDWLGIADHITPKVMHDLGKLVFALCMFWAYTAFAQLLPIWYTNMPEETEFLLIRMKLPAWGWMAQTVAILCFLTPWTVLLSRGIKKMKWPLIAILSLIMFGVFMERTWLVMPSIYFGDAFPWDKFLIISLGTLAGFAGLFITVVSQVLANVPALAISDPDMEEHPWDEHVHPISDSAGAH